jgi:16S rRNA (guanine527-N7)-methyltransferase
VQELKRLLKENLEIDLNSRQVEQFSKYFKFLNEFNSHTNITRIAPEEIPLLHFYDSLTLSKFLDLSAVKTLIDIGSGAGFPGVPLKIIFPNLKVTLVDSKRKKTNFLNELIEILELENIEAVHGRAEDLGKDKKYRESFELVTVRAVSETKDLVKLVLPFIYENGSIILYKGPKAESELENAKPELKRYKLKAELYSFSLPGSGQKRVLLELRHRLRGS